MLRVLRSLPKPEQKKLEKYLLRKEKKRLLSMKRGSLSSLIARFHNPDQSISQRTIRINYFFSKVYNTEKNHEIDLYPKPERTILAEAIPNRRLEGSGMGDILSPKEAIRRLEDATVDIDSTDWAETELLGAGELAERLGVARASVNNWRAAKKIIAFQKGVRNFVYPWRQFNEHAPMKGIERVLQHFSTNEDAWEWLVTPNLITNSKPPIELLRSEKLDEVVRAAEGSLDFA